MTQAYWNGLPTQARQGTAVVYGDSSFPNYWAKELIGQRVPVVEIILDNVNFGGGTGYLYNEDDVGWLKVTVGRGSPQIGHRNVMIEKGSFVPNMDDEEQSLFEKEVAELGNMVKQYDEIVAGKLPVKSSPNRQNRRLMKRMMKKKGKRNG